MNLESSRDAAPQARIPRIVEALSPVSPQGLADTVQSLAYPRHYVVQPDANRRARNYVAERLRAAGYLIELTGPYGNVLAVSASVQSSPLTLVGAHYDSTPGTPGADDNASAVAALLTCADIMAQHFPDAPVGFVSFNREEDGLIGSADFVQSYLPESGLDIRRVHILEMVGYCDPAQGAQRTPPGLPVPLPPTGDWLGLVGNAASTALVDTVLTQAQTYLPEFPVFGLKLPPGAEALLPVLQRSDHAPFWEARIPALQWTDTAEFRNPHYHQQTDTPETLDYNFLAQVTRLLIACVAAPAV